MGQARDESLEHLLMLGEPEAVVAVVHAQGLSEELARRAWWAMPTAENARRMLLRETVVQSAMGPVLAEYLVDYLPFEQEPSDIIESVRLVLQPGLVDQDTQDALWQKARTKNAYYVGFLLAVPDSLPEPEPPRADLQEHAHVLSSLVDKDNRYAKQLLRAMDSPGQTFLRTVARVLKKPGNQDVVNLLLDGVAANFSAVRPEGDSEAVLADLMTDADRFCEGRTIGDRACPGDLKAVLQAAPGLKREVHAMLVLSRLGYPVVRPVFAHTTAIGSLMRRKLEPITSPLLAEIAALRGVSS
jgi:hypothetical protein